MNRKPFIMYSDSDFPPRFHPPPAPQTEINVLSWICWPITFPFVQGCCRHWRGILTLFFPFLDAGKLLPPHSKAFVQQKRERFFFCCHCQLFGTKFLFVFFNIRARVWLEYNHTLCRRVNAYAECIFRTCFVADTCTR